MPESGALATGLVLAVACAAVASVHQWVSRGSAEAADAAGVHALAQILTSARPLSNRLGDVGGALSQSDTIGINTRRSHLVNTRWAGPL